MFPYFLSGVSALSFSFLEKTISYLHGQRGGWKDSFPFSLISLSSPFLPYPHISATFLPFPLLSSPFLPYPHISATFLPLTVWNLKIEFPLPARNQCRSQIYKIVTHLSKKLMLELVFSPLLSPCLSFLFLFL